MEVEGRASLVSSGLVDGEVRPRSIRSGNAWY